MSDDVLDMFDIENQPQEAEQTDSAPDQGDDQAAEATEAPVEATEEADGGTDTPDPAAEAQETAEEAPAEGEKLLAGKYKTVEDLEKAYTEDLGELQRIKNTEIDTLKQQMEQQQAQMQQFAAMQQQQAVSSVDDEQIVRELQTNPYGAMGWLMETQPQRVSEGISAIRELHGNELADKMMLEIQQQQVQGTQQQVQAQYEAMQQPAVVQGNIQSAMGQLTEKYGDEFEELSEDVAKIVEGFEGIDFNNPAAISNALEVGFLHAWRARASEAAKTSVPQASSPQEFVETGTPGQEPEASPEEQILNDVVEQFNANQY